MRQPGSLAGGDSTNDSLDEWSDLCSDYEDELRTAKRKKSSAYGIQPPKRSRLKAAVREVSSPSDSFVSTADLPPEKPPQVNTRRASPQHAARAKNANKNITADDIYNAVLSGKGAMVTVVDEWLDTYKQSRELGLLVLVNFLVQSCGCKGVVTEEMFSSQQHAEIISTLTKEFNEDSVNYPLSTPGPQLKRFKANLCEFAKVLVRSCRNSLVFDEYLFPTLLALLTGLSDSQVRAFRHTSTLFAVKLLTGLVEVAAHLSVQIQTLQRRYDIEFGKTAFEQTPERLEELHATISQLHDNREELASIMNATFRGVFVHRYRDKLPEIRAACIEEMGMWLKTDPEDFLNDGCMKYLGWTLHDKQSPVRLQCVRALQGLYKEKEFIGRLELFTSRFKERILSMVLDKEPDVALEVVNLLLLIQQSTEEGLTEVECGHIYPLVYASHRGLACAAANFLYHRMEWMAAEQKLKSFEKGAAAFIQMVMAFYIQCEFHEHAAYLVDSLWDVAGAELRSWETMTAFLLDENGIQDEEESALIEIMVCAVQRASQATPPVGRAHGRKILSAKDKKIQDQDRSRITAHFIPLLPQLLAKYSADEAKVTLLLKVPLCFDLELFSSAQGMSNHLENLLTQVCAIVEKHTDSSVLEACAHLVSSLCSDCYTFSSRAHTAFGQLLDTLSDCFNSYLSELLQGSADEDDVYHAAVALKRIGALSCAKDPTAWKLFDGCLQLLSSRVETTEVEVELMVSALKCAAFHLMWAKVNTVNSSLKQAEMKILKREVRSFCKVCQSCLSVTAAEIREQAFELLCDLLLLFSETSVRSEPELQTLVHLPSDSLRSEMAAFLVDYVFTDDEELNEVGEEAKIARLQKKRNQLAGYCKLVMYGVLDLAAATDVFKHYSKYFKDYGDIIKEVISKSKLINPVLSAKTVCLSLQQLFSEMLTEEQSKQDLGEIRDLAKRLAMSFGIDLHRARAPLVALHMDGVGFAFRASAEEELQNVPFLEILTEFSFKLLPKDRAQIASHVKSQCPDAALCWSPVRMYLRSLESRSKPKDHGEGLSAVTSDQNSPLPKRKRTTVNASALDSSGVHSSLTPVLSSTVLKEPSKALASGDHGGGLSSEPLSEDDFSTTLSTSLLPGRSQTSTRRLPTVRQADLNSHLTLLSLIDDVEEEEPDIEDFASDSSNTTDSQHLTTPSVLDTLFD
ncbi:unnamed protein product [Knipowitschia caucasica]|uniref:Cohesin subunit SA n=1 Tax=Knipowitschia caucasica TaxID=637954 RepID=A0AAV2MHF8_KNICA